MPVRSFIPASLSARPVFPTSRRAASSLGPLLPVPANAGRVARPRRGAAPAGGLSGGRTGRHLCRNRHGSPPPTPGDRRVHRRDRQGVGVLLPVCDLPVVGMLLPLPRTTSRRPPPQRARRPPPDVRRAPGLLCLPPPAISPPKKSGCGVCPGRPPHTAWRERMTNLRTPSCAASMLGNVQRERVRLE